MFLLQLAPYKNCDLGLRISDNVDTLKAYFEKENDDIAKKCIYKQANGEIRIIYDAGSMAVKVTFGRIIEVEVI